MIQVRLCSLHEKKPPKLYELPKMYAEFRLVICTQSKKCVENWKGKESIQKMQKKSVLCTQFVHSLLVFCI